MIKINLEEKTKKEIEDLYSNDMKAQKTGLRQCLMTNKSILQKQPKLYRFLHNDKDELQINQVTKLLFANFKTMCDIIAKIGPCDKSIADELLNHVFRYDSFSKRNVAYEILQKMDVPVCPYCNRQYTSTLNSRKMRPQFDHYFPKSLYPYLALSLYNLVPCCPMCNQAKGALDTKSKPILYPYEEEFGIETKFTLEYAAAQFVKIRQGLSADFDVVIVVEEQESKIKRQSNKLCLEELYKAHNGYIVDLLKNMYINPPARMEQLSRQFPDLFPTKEIAISTILMTDIKKSNWGTRPLAKLTHDIYQEFSNK